MPPSIHVSAVRAGSGWTCSVSVEAAGEWAFNYTVHVTESDVERLGKGSAVEDLVERSFAFLLDREPPSSILREFQLTEIERYFPEYPRLITT